MAELNLFSYRPALTFIHQLDARLKLLLVVLINLASLRASFFGLTTLSIPIIWGFCYLKVPLFPTLKQSRFFFLLLFLTFLSRVFFTQSTDFWQVYTFKLGIEGIQSGTMFCWRMTLILVTGIIFISSAKTEEINAATQWYFKPIPFIPEKRLGTMISLMIRFLPLIMEKADEIHTAQKSRGIEGVKNPIKRLVLFSVPLIKKVFESADRMVIAMEARCYNEDRTLHLLKLNKKDVVFSVSLSGYLICSILV